MKLKKNQTANVKNEPVYKRLTKKEEIIMNWFWEKGPLYIKELQDFYPDPKPHFNTLSTQVRTLETNGFVSHNLVNNSFQYFATVDRHQFSEMSLDNLIGKCFGKSYLNVVSTFVKEEKITIDDLKGLIDEIEKGKEV